MTEKVKNVILDLPKDRKIELPYREIETEAGIIKSVSRVFPLSEEVLIIQYGVVDMIKLFTAVSQKRMIGGMGYYKVGGLGQNVPDFIEMNMKVMMKHEGDMQLRPTPDPANKYSLDAIRRQVQEDKNLFAAITIANNKEMSKVGLHLDTKTVAPAVIEKAEKFDKNKNLGNTLYTGELVTFVNYFTCHYTNIGNVIYD